MRRNLPAIALLLAAAFWGVALPFFKAAEHVPPFSFALLRFVIAFLCVSPFYLLSKQHQKMQFKDMPLLLVTALCGITLNIGLLFVGLRHTSAIDTAVITNLTPILMIIPASIFLKEAITKTHVIGLIMAFIGALVVIGEPLLQTDITNTENVFGNILVVLAVFSWIAFNILSKELFKHYSALTVTTYLFLFGVLSFAPLAAWEFVKNPTWFTQLDYIDISGVIYYALFGSVGAYFLYEWGLAKSSTALAGETHYIEPIVTISVAVLLLGEKITLPFVIGATCIFCGVMYASSHFPKLFWIKHKAPQSQTSVC